MTQLEYFRLFASEFSSVDNTTVGTWLGIAETLVNVGCLDAERSAMAIALYAAHLLSLSNKAASSSGAVGGGIIREKEGDLERQYDSVKGSDTYLGQTSYGQQYLDITRACYGAAIMTRGGSYV